MNSLPCDIDLNDGWCHIHARTCSLSPESCDHGFYAIALLAYEMGLAATLPGFCPECGIGMIGYASPAGPWATTVGMTEPKFPSAPWTA